MAAIDSSSQNTLETMLLMQKSDKNDRKYFSPGDHGKIWAWPRNSKTEALRDLEPCCVIHNVGLPVILHWLLSSVRPL